MTKLNKEDFEFMRGHKTVRDALEFFQEHIGEPHTYFPNGYRLALAVIDIFGALDDIKGGLLSERDLKEKLFEILGSEMCFEDQVEKNETTEHCKCAPSQPTLSSREFTVTEVINLFNAGMITNKGGMELLGINQSKANRYCVCSRIKSTDAVRVSENKEE